MKCKKIKKQFEKLVKQAKIIEERCSTSIIDFIPTFNHQEVIINNHYLYYREH